MGCNTLKMYLNDKTFNLKLALELFPVNDEGGDGGPVEFVLMELGGSSLQRFRLANIDQ